MDNYEARKKRRQSLVGIITSDKNPKTITVQVSHEKYFPKYNKSMRTRRNVHAHDEEGRGSVGDIVRIVPCRPVSKKKRHTIIDILRKKET